MKNYATFNIQKVKTFHGLRSRDRHNRREYLPDTVDEERIPLNVYSQDENGKDDEAYEVGRQLFYDVQTERKEAGARALRRTTVPAVELVLGASEAFFEGKTRAEIDEWFKANEEWAKEYYKDKGQLLSVANHYDESNPHQHLLFAPVITKKDKTTGKDLRTFSAKTFHGNKAAMNRARSSHAEAMMSFGLVRGKNKYLENKGKPLAKDYKKQTQKEFVADTNLAAEKLREVEAKIAEYETNPIQSLFDFAANWQVDNGTPFESFKGYDEAGKAIMETSYDPIKESEWMELITLVPGALVPYLNYLAHNKMIDKKVRSTFNIAEPITPELTTTTRGR